METDCQSITGGHYEAGTKIADHKRSYSFCGIREFGTKNYESASVNAICNTGQISKGLFYHNKNKDEIYLECSVGLMIGTELVWNKIRRFGKSIIITTLTQSLGTFLVVSLVFGIVFSIMDIPIYLALIFGGIALATAPAPALSIVREFKTNGPAPESAKIVQGTIAAAAVINEIIAVIAAKKGFEWAGELKPAKPLNSGQAANTQG